MAIRNKLKGSEGDNDRISSLPDSLLTHILSFLPTRNAVNTAVLSNRWRCLWVDIPALDIDIREDDPQGLVFLEKVPALHASPKLYKLRLFVKHAKLSADLAWGLDSLVRCAVAHNVEDLHLVWRKLCTTWYPLPREVYSCGSLRKLTTRGCQFSTTGIRLSSLRVLDVASVTLSDDKVAGMLAGCPALESLRLRGFSGISRVDVMSPNLKELVMDYCLDTLDNGNQDLCICAPHVKELRLSGSWLWLNPSLVNVCSVVRAGLEIECSKRDRDKIWWRKILKMVQQCEQLEVGRLCLKLLSRQDPSCTLFSNLRCLVVRYCDDVQKLCDVIRCSPILEKLIVQFAPTYDRKGSLQNMCNDLEFRLGPQGSSLSNIKIVELRGVEVPSFPFAEFLLKYLAMLEKMVIFSASSVGKASLLRLTKALLVLKRSSPHAIVEVH